MIRIQNIYYMLAYAFQVLRAQGYREVAAEEFDNVAELCAALLACGIRSQLKRGLRREYANQTEALSSLRGKIELSDSVKTRSILRRQMVCTHDEFSVDTHLNRIIKATVMLLIRSDIAKSRKKEFRRLMEYFADVGTVDPATIDWNVRYDRNNQTYRMLIAVCWLVVKGLLQTQSDGTMRLMDVLDEQRMSRLYEKFILEYYRQEHSELKASASFIDWALDDNMSDLLPAMKSDIMLSQGSRVLIIDAKYYVYTMQHHFDVRTIHSSNLYQMFTYVKNKEALLADIDHEVSGLVLYAKTDEDIQPNKTYHMSGNKIGVRTLDLDCDFTDVMAQLDAIVKEHFG